MSSSDPLQKAAEATEAVITEEDSTALDLDQDISDVKDADAVDLKEEEEDEEEDVFDRLSDDFVAKTAVENNQGRRVSSRKYPTELKIQLKSNNNKSDDVDDNNECDQIVVEEGTDTADNDTCYNIGVNNSSCELVSYDDDDDLIDFFRGVYDEEQRNFMDSSPSTGKLSFGLDHDALFNDYLQNERGRMDAYLEQKFKDLRERVAIQINNIHKDLIMQRDFQLKQVS